MIYLKTLNSAIKMAEALLESGYAIHIKQINKGKYELTYKLQYSVYAFRFRRRHGFWKIYSK